MKIKASILVVIFVMKLFTINLCFADEFSISIATTDQKYPSSASCDDNFFVAWEDSRRGTTNLNIYGQLVLGSGSSPTAGYAITVELGNQTSPCRNQLVSRRPRTIVSFSSPYVRCVIPVAVTLPSWSLCSMKSLLPRCFCAARCKVSVSFVGINSPVTVSRTRT